MTIVIHIYSKVQFTDPARAYYVCQIKIAVLFCLILLWYQMFPEFYFGSFLLVLFDKELGLRISLCIWNMFSFVAVYEFD